MLILRATVEEFKSAYFLSRYYDRPVLKNTCNAIKGAVRCLRAIWRVTKHE